MTLAQVMTELEALGSAQTVKTYRRHGAKGDLFGVSFANLGKLKKRIGTNHKLALELWATGNGDARTLATMIADPQLISAAQLEKWVDEAAFHGLVDALVSHVAAKRPDAPEMAKNWTASPDEWRGRAGWQLLAHLAMAEDSLTDAEFARYLKVIEREIHKRPNRAREAMNSALIAIGVRNSSLEAKALAASVKIGKVEVDHGDTSCQTPDAAEYIAKTITHRRKKAGHA